MQKSTHICINLCNVLDTDAYFEPIFLLLHWRFLRCLIAFFRHLKTPNQGNNRILFKDETQVATKAVWDEYWLLLVIVNQRLSGCLCLIVESVRGRKNIN